MGYQNRNKRNLPSYVEKVTKNKYRVRVFIDGKMNRLSKLLDSEEEAIEFAMSHPLVCAKFLAKEKFRPNPVILAGKILEILESSPGELISIDKSLYGGNRFKLASALKMLRERYKFDISSYYVGRYQCRYQLCGHWRNPDGEYFDYLKEKESK